jgi:copper chaperone CopZ
MSPLSEHLFFAATLLILGFAVIQLSYLGKAAIMVQAAVDKVTEQLKKVYLEVTQAKAELASKIADLQLQLDDNNVADVIDLTELVAAAQALDDIVPDAAPSEVVPDAVPDEVVPVDVVEVEADDDDEGVLPNDAT